MSVQRIEMMGPEYVVTLGVWWGVAVLLTVAFLTIKRTVVRRHRRAGQGPLPAAGSRFGV